MSIPQDSNILIFGPSRCGKTYVAKKLVVRAKTVVFTNKPDEWDDIAIEAISPGEYSDQALRIVPLEDRNADIQIIVDGATGDESKSLLLSGVSQSAGCSVVATIDTIDKFDKIYGKRIYFGYMLIFRHPDAKILLDKFDIDPGYEKYDEMTEDHYYMLIKIEKAKND
jgi:hypothetical protein